MGNAVAFKNNDSIFTRYGNKLFSFVDEKVIMPAGMSLDFIVADIENRKLGRKSSSDEFDRFFIGFFSDNNNG